MIRVGIIGAGAMGRYVARLLQQQSNDVQFAALYDPDAAAVDLAIKTIPFSGDVVSSAEAVLASDCDWVMIASLNDQHANQTIAAFEAGKHVFCQKPLATTFEDCLRMRDAWLKSGRQFVIGFTLRYSPHFRKLKAMLQEGAIGDIISLEFNETLPFNHGGFIHGDWRRHRSVAGSHVLEKCSHDIDIVNWLVDSRVSRVASFGGTNFFKPENAFHIDRLERNQDGFEAYRFHGGQARGENPFLADKDIFDNQVVILEFENEVRATFHMSANTAIPERRLYICGTQGTLRADVMSGTIELQKIGFDTKIRDCGTGASGMHGGGDPVLAAELFAVMSGTGEMSAGIKEGLDAATTCFAIDTAADTRQVVDLSDYWRQVDHGDH